MTLFENARDLISRILAPQDYDQFFEEYVSNKPLALLGDDHPERTRMLGDDPKQVILDAFHQHAAKLTCHAHSPSGPPPTPRAVSSTSEYHDLVREYHSRDYTVRIPDAGNLSHELKKFTRALEITVGNPADTVVFWSEAGAVAPVHFDNHDIIAIQLTGQKKWFLSNDQSLLPNDWSKLGEGPPEMTSYATHDVSPGDLLYIPRGTAHTVQSTSESIHLSIGFLPVTVRDMMIAILDHYSDEDRSIRANASSKPDDFAIGRSPPKLSSDIMEHFEKLLSAMRDPNFLTEAMELRQSRMVADRPNLSPSQYANAVSRNSKIRRTDLAIAKLSSTPAVLDLSKPGDHILVHVGAEPALRFMLEQDEFSVSDIPGEISDDNRIALTTKLMEGGLLQIAD